MVGCCCFCLCFCFFCLVFFLGGRGQVRWPKGPPHLAINPPYLFVFVFFLFLLSFLCFIIESPVFAPKKAIFVYFLCVSLCFSLAFFGPPPFSLSLYLSLSCSFLSSFLPVVHVCFWFLFFLFVLFASCFKMLFCFSFSACCLVLF